MKQVTDTLHDVQGDQMITIKSGVNKNKLKKLYSMLSNIYRNPISSIVREYTSNALDANKEAFNFKTLDWEDIIVKYPWVNDVDSGISMTQDEFIELKAYIKEADVNEPVVVGVAKDDAEQLYFYVKDYGIGLSPKRMENIFFDYLSSTKEETDDEKGGFGIGAKSALAYHHTFFIDTIYKGTLYKYMMTKDKEGMPEGKLIVSLPSAEDNGTTIRVMMKNNSSSDGEKFARSTKSMLLYMSNVYYDCLPIASNMRGIRSHNFNDSKIFNNTLWKYSTIASSSFGDMHISLDNVPYTIDWNELGISSINCPIAINFNISEIKPTPSRESILYTEHSRNIIIKRINEVKQFFADYIASETLPTDNYIEAYNHKDDKVTSYTLDTTHRINLINLLPNSNFKRKVYKPFINSNISFNQHIDFPSDYKLICKFYKGSISLFYGSRCSNVMLSNAIQQKSFIVLLNRTNVSNKEIYFIIDKLKSIPSDKEIVFLKKSPVNLKMHIRNLKLNKFSKSKWREMITTSKLPFEDIADLTIDLDDVKNMMDPNWETLFDLGMHKWSPPTAIAQTIEKGTFKFKGLYNRKHSTILSNLTFKRKRLLEIYSIKSNGMVVFCDITDKRALMGIRDWMFDKNRDANVEYFIFYKKDIKKIKEMELNNWYHVDEVLQSESNKFTRLATGAIIFGTYNDMMSKSCQYEDLKKLSPILADNMAEVTAYMVDTHNALQSELRSYLDMIKASALLNNNYDSDIVLLVKKINDVFNSVPLLRLLEHDTLDEYHIMYDMAQLLINKRVRVKDEFYNPKTEYLLTKLIESQNYITTQEYACNLTIEEEFNK